MRSTLKKYYYETCVFIFFVLSRLPSLGHEIFNTDVWKWKARIFDFGQGIFTFNFEQTLQRYHPGVTLMWLGSIGVKLNSFYYKIILGITPPDNDISAIFTLHFFQKLVIVLCLGLTLASVFYVLRSVFSKTYALIFIVLLTLEPFYAALTRVIHLEGLMSTFMLASFVWLYYYLSAPKNKVLYLSAFFAALAFLTKTSALFLLAFVPLVLFLNIYLGSRMFTKSIRLAIWPFMQWLLASLAVYAILWPALWVMPVDVFASLGRGIFETGIEEGHIQYYFGNLVQDPGITFYPVVFLARSSFYLILGLLGVFFVYKKSYFISKRFLLYVFLFVFFYTIEMSLPSKKLDRYLLPALVVSLLVSSVFFTWLVTSLSARFKPNYLLPLLFIPSLVQMYVLHPDYFSYYSPIIGGLRYGIHVIEPKWLIGKDPIVEYFTNLKQAQNLETFQKEEAFDTLFANEELGTRLVIGFPEKYYTQIHPFIREIGAWAIIKDLTPHAKVATYFVYPVWEDDSQFEDRFKIEYVDSIYLRGVPVYNVYKRVVDQ